jgi:hypothetical protein
VPVRAGATCHPFLASGGRRPLADSPRGASGKMRSEDSMRRARRAWLVGFMSPSILTGQAAPPRTDTARE